MDIEWCVRNEQLGTRDIISRIRSLPSARNITFSRYACTEDCALCCRSPFVLLNHKERLTAESRDALLAKVEARILSEATEDTD